MSLRTRKLLYTALPLCTALVTPLTPAPGRELGHDDEPVCRLHRRIRTPQHLSRRRAPPPPRAAAMADRATCPKSPSTWLHW